MFTLHIANPSSIPNPLVFLWTMCCPEGRKIISGPPPSSPASAPPAHHEVLSLPVLLVAALWLLSEGPALAQAAPSLSSTFESIPNKEEFGRTMGETAQHPHQRE